MWCRGCGESLRKGDAAAGAGEGRGSVVVDEAPPLAPWVGRQLEAGGTHLPVERPAQKPIVMALMTFTTFTTLVALISLMALMTLMTLMVFVSFASLTTAS